MKTIEVTTTVTATVEETWVIRVDDTTAERIIAEPYLALDALAGNDIDCEVVSVENTAVRDEENRDIETVRLIDAVPA